MVAEVPDADGESMRVNAAVIDWAQSIEAPTRERAVEEAKASLGEGHWLVVPKRYAVPGEIKRGDAPLIAEGF